MSTPEEQTSGIEEARRALAESRQSNRGVDKLIADTRKSFDQVREAHAANHFADKFRRIIRGAA